KTQLYEGGVRSSLIAWGPGLLAKKDHLNRQSVFSAIDLVPTILDLTGTPHPRGVTYDGQSVVDVLLGRANASRKAPLFFRRPPDRDAFYGDNDLPDLAVRAGKWKFLCEYDGAEPELYDMDTDRGETRNVAAGHPKVVARLSGLLRDWHQSMPPDRGADFIK
ncbi:MAG: N-acetylgalactosamine-6-sulfatase, partial [Phycisphaeraceae bacterium]|nr:N-acetylgalactosamine-6-sulfatase [Phycisphaeraceae bacterium]